MKKLLTCLLLIYSLVFLTACPKAPKNVRDFREKSAQLSVIGTEIIKAFGEGYKAGEISQSQLSTLNAITGPFVKGVGVYRGIVKKAEEYIARGEQIPTDLLSQIERSLHSDVEATFFAITDVFKVLSPAAQERVKAIFSGLRIVIATLKTLIADARVELALPKREMNYGLA